MITSFNYSELNGVLIYPDSIDKFSEVERVGGLVYAEYNGDLPLPSAVRPYTGVAIRRISKRAFWVRMNTLVANLENTLITDRDNVATAEPKRSKLRAALRSFDLALYLDLDNASTAQFVGLLVAYAYLTAPQGVTLLANGVPAEAWNGIL